jgi:sugar phosphate isomerase/epimerase
MSLNLNRRTFLGSGALLAARPALSAPAAKPSKLKLGICSYSFGNKVKLPEVVAGVKALNVNYLNIKPEFHLPYNSSPTDIAEARKLLSDAGIQLVGTGTTYFPKPDESEIRQRFEYNKALGSPLIVIGPTAETIHIVEKFVKEYDIRVAIHNHGPSDKNFPTPQSALAVIKGMDPRVGLCMDIGHTTRSGIDAAAAAKEAGPRLLDMHTKDVKKTIDGKWVGVDCGEGDINTAALFRQLAQMGYAGYCNLEYEVGPAQQPDKMLGMQKSMAYLRGVAAGIAAS